MLRYESMEYISDLHIHSRYARACSPELTVPNIATWCQRKGINIVGTGDFTHPKWFAELQEHLILCEEHAGLYRTRDSHEPHFLCATELSCIYSEDGKVRRVHHVVLAPSLEIVKKINNALEARGCNNRSDGRPILGLKSRELLKMFLEIDAGIVMIPAHAWTPHFAIFGSKSGYDSIEECFGDLASHIFAVETGLSSDPAMNWRLSKLDNITLISNSDAHSLGNLGREANVFVGEQLSYQNLVVALKRQVGPLQLRETLEFYPQEGKYHLDGHAPCSVRLEPSETQRAGGRCPKCQILVTVGVVARVEALADRSAGEKPPNAIPYRSLVPLGEIIAEAFDVGKGTKRVKTAYDRLVADGRTEFAILRDLDYETLGQVSDSRVVEGIRRVREGKLKIQPGYDGVYGTIKIFSDAERKKFEQKTLI